MHRCLSMVGMHKGNEWQSTEPQLMYKVKRVCTVWLRMYDCHETATCNKTFEQGVPNLS